MVLVATTVVVVIRGNDGFKACIEFSGDDKEFQGITYDKVTSDRKQCFQSSRYVITGTNEYRQFFNVAAQIL